MVTAVEVGLSRVLRVALSKKTDKKLPPLPSYDEAMGRRVPADAPAPGPAWIDGFERVNKVGQYGRERFRNVDDTDEEA